MISPDVLSVHAAPDGAVSIEDVRALVARACPADDYRGRRVLLIVPDATRTAPVDQFFRALHAQSAAATRAFDVMVALGTHPPMSEAAICERLGISAEERGGRLPRRGSSSTTNGKIPTRLRSLGTIPAAEIDALSGGLFAMDVPVRVNRRLFEYDQTHHRRAGVPARGRRVFGRQQISVSRRQRAGGAEFFSLARRGRHQPDDHRPQAHAGPPASWTARRRW